MKILQSGPGRHIIVQNKKCLNFCSNNYLGFAQDAVLKKAAKQAITQYGVGTTSVRALIGTNTLHQTLEKTLSRFKNTQDAVVVTSGYLANMVVLQTFFTPNDIVISDELNHASIIDAIRLAQIKHKYIFKHAIMKSLKKALQQARALQKTQPDAKVLIVTDGVFSMDGDIAPLPDIVQLAHSYKAQIMVDDAHGEGVLGKHGRGIVDHFSLHGAIDFEVGTLSKAFGVNGGFVAGSKHIADTIRTKARQFLFSNALAIPDTAALIKAIEILMIDDTRINTLWSNSHYLQDQLKTAGFDIGHTHTPITPIMLYDEEVTKKAELVLFRNNIVVSSIIFPMVPHGAARLRVMPSSLHTKRDIDLFVTIIKKIFRPSSHRPKQQSQRV